MAVMYKTIIILQGYMLWYLRVKQHNNHLLANDSSKYKKRVYLCGEREAKANVTAF